MHFERHSWYSPRLGRVMPLAIYGHAGAPVIVFPTSGGSLYEAYDFGIMDAVRPMVERGHVQFWCVDSVDRHSWYNYRAHPGWRSFYHDQFDQYVRHEVVPFIHDKNPNRFISTFGCSFGAYHAMNFGLRHPEAIARILSFSGNYRIDDFVRGYWDDRCYFNSPLAYMWNLGESHHLHRIRQQRIILTTTKHGEVPGLGHATYELSQSLWRKGVGHDYVIWEHGHHKHDWPTWREMAQTYL
jgi:esterase/lipase superfamily enzyme